jgi:hypothetical protein
MSHLAAVLLSLALVLPALAAEELPGDAKELLADYESDLVAIQKRAEEEKRTRRAALAADLEDLQAKYTKAGDLDQAVAIRDVVRALKAGAYGTEKGPANLTGYRNQTGKVLFFEVVGSTDSGVFGTDIYTADSSLAAAAVHAGVLKNGEKGVVKVTILPGQAEYKASSRNGVTSLGWYAYDGSYRVESLDAKPAPPPSVRPAEIKPAGGTGVNEAVKKAEEAVKKAKELIVPSLDKIR